MNLQTFFEQLSLQLGICKVQKVKKRRKKKEVEEREVVARGGLTAAQSELLRLYWDIRNKTYGQFKLRGVSPVKPEHIHFIRETAQSLNREKQHNELTNSRRDKFLATEDAWEIWEEIFEDFVKELHLEHPSNKE